MRRFPPPWIIEEHNNACFIVKDATGQALAYVYFEDESGRRSADVRFQSTAVIGCVSSETARSRMTLAEVANSFLGRALVTYDHRFRRRLMVMGGP